MKTAVKFKVTELAEIPAEYLGAIIIDPEPPHLYAYIRFGLTDEQREGFTQWAVERVERAFESGNPKEDAAWRCLNDGRMALFCREFVVPVLGMR